MDWGLFQVTGLFFLIVGFFIFLIMPRGSTLFVGVLFGILGISLIFLPVDSMIKTLLEGMSIPYLRGPFMFIALLFAVMGTVSMGCCLYGFIIRRRHAEFSKPQCSSSD